MTDWTAAAAAVLAEVGLSFDDVYDLGRPWRRGPEGLSFIVGRPRYAGICHRPSSYNLMSRRKHLIGITGPIDCEIMFAVLAHECGHAALDHGRFISTPTYEQEAQAELYALETICRHLGREPHPHIVDVSKKHVRRYCWHRFHELGAAPTKRWNRSIVEWCGFDPGTPLDFGDNGENNFGSVAP